MNHDFTPGQDSLDIEAQVMAEGLKDGTVLLSKIKVTEFPPNFPEEWALVDFTPASEFPSYWIRPDKAQALMDESKRSPITDEQALGWLLLKSYGRA